MPMGSTVRFVGVFRNGPVVPVVTVIGVHHVISNSRFLPDRCSRAEQLTSIHGVLCLPGMCRTLNSSRSPETQKTGVRSSARMGNKSLAFLSMERNPAHVSVALSPGGSFPRSGRRIL